MHAASAVSAQPLTSVVPPRERQGHRHSARSTHHRHRPGLRSMLCTRQSARGGLSRLKSAKSIFSMQPDRLGGVCRDSDGGVIVNGLSGGCSTASKSRDHAGRATHAQLSPSKTSGSRARTGSTCCLSAGCASPPPGFPSRTSSPTSGSGTVCDAVCHSPPLRASPACVPAPPVCQPRLCAPHTRRLMRHTRVAWCA